MQELTGLVADHWTKMKSTRYGDKNIHWFRMEDGTEFNTGFKKEFSKGEHVSIVVDMKYGALQYEPSIKPGTPAAKATPAATKGSSYTPKAKGAFPIDPKDGQMSIIRQSSLTRAIEAVDAMQTSELLNFANDGDYLRYVLKTALIFTDYASGNDIMHFDTEDGDDE